MTYTGDVTPGGPADVRELPDLTITKVSVGPMDNNAYLLRCNVTGEQMLQILETRLDNVCYHLGFANTRAAARQLVSHGHVRVNGRKVNIPSFGLKVNDAVEIKNSNAARQLATKNLEIAGSRAVPDWLSLNKEALKGVVMRIPTRDEIQPIANEQAVVEFYSR